MLKRSVRGKGGQPPFDQAMMFEILLLQALYSHSDEAVEFGLSPAFSSRFEQSPAIWKESDRMKR